MPDPPVVHVAAFVVAPVVRVVAPASAGGAGPEGAGGIALVHHPAEHPFVEPVVIDQVPVAVLPRDLVPVERPQVLVVAAPQGQAGVVAQALDLVAGLLLDAG